jgi:hypothetical protein
MIATTIGAITPTEIVPTITPITSFRIVKRRSAFVGFGFTTAMAQDTAGTTATDCGSAMA